MAVVLLRQTIDSDLEIPHIPRKQLAGDVRTQQVAIRSHGRRKMPPVLLHHLSKERCQVFNGCESIEWFATKPTHPETVQFFLPGFDKLFDSTAHARIHGAPLEVLI